MVIDRRTRKTKAAIQAEFVQLMTQKAINEITIRELAAGADINRRTFYLHYTDIYDLLHQTEDTVIEQFQTTLMTFELPATGHSAGQAFFKLILQYVYANRTLLHVLCQNPDSELMNKLVKMTISEGQTVIPFKHPTNAAYLLNYCCWGLIGILHTALRQSSVDFDALDQLVDQLLIHSLAVDELID